MPNDNTFDREKVPLSLGALGQIGNALLTADPDISARDLVAHFDKQLAFPLETTPADKMAMSVGPRNAPLPTLPGAGALGAIAPAAAPPQAPPPLSDHRERGTLGRIGHALGTIGRDVGVAAGSAFIPTVMPFIPGTPQQKWMQERQQQERQGFATEQAGTQAETALKEAQARALGEKPSEPRAEWKPIPETNFEINNMTGETRAMAGVPERAGKSDPNAAARAGFEKQGYNATFDESGKVTGLTPIPGFKTKPAPMEKAVAGTVNGQTAWGIQTPQGWIDSETRNPLPNFKPPENWAQGIAPTRTLQLLNPQTGLPETYQYNPATGGYDKPVGTPGGGAYPHQMESANALQRMVTQNVLPLIDTMAKKGEMGVVTGRLSDWLNRDMGNAPPDVAQLHQLINGTVSMMMGMYGFRRQEAVDELSKQMGARMTPESMKGALTGILQHAQSITEGVGGPAKPGALPPGATAGTLNGKHGYVLNGEFHEQ